MSVSCDSYTRVCVYFYKIKHMFISHKHTSQRPVIYTHMRISRDYNMRTYHVITHTYLVLFSADWSGE